MGGSDIQRIIERQARFWEVRQRLAEQGGEPARRALAHLVEGPWITVSKQWGSGGEEIARALAGELGWQAFDHEILAAIAEHTHSREVVLSRVDERAIGQFNDYVAQLLVPNDPGQLAYLQEMVRVIWGLARQGNAVIVGRGANWFLKPQYGLRVRLLAPVERRARRIAEQQGITPTAARQRVRDTDAAQSQFIRQVYGRDIDDPLGYDLVLNLEGLTERAAVQTMRTALEHKLAPATR